MHEEIIARSVVIKNEQDQISYAHSSCNVVIQKLGFCWGRISVCHSPSTMLPCLQKGSGKMPRGDILNIKQRRATQSSFRSHKYCVFHGQDPCCTFNIPLCRIPCNCHVPVSKLWPISDQRKAGEVAGRAVWHGYTLRYFTQWQNSGWHLDVGSESGNGHSLTGPSRSGEKKNRGEWNIERGMLSQLIVRELLCCRAAPAPSLPLLGSLHGRTSYSITNICQVRFLLSSHLPG